MASPRPPLKPVRLDLRTFGDSPAAIYLVELLNQKNDPGLARRVARILTEGRELITDLARAHLEYDALSTRTLARLIPLISAHYQKQIAEPLRRPDGTTDHIANLVINVLEGGLKTWKNRVQQARRNEHEAARRLAPGVSFQWLPAVPLVNETTNAQLRSRSKRYLARKGKLDTLY